MAAIDDVITWANTLPAWLGDSIRRFLLVGEQPLSPKDYSEILALAKADLRSGALPGQSGPHPACTRHVFRRASNKGASHASLNR